MPQPLPAEERFACARDHVEGKEEARVYTYETLWYVSVRPPIQRSKLGGGDEEAAEAVTSKAETGWMWWRIPGVEEGG